MCRIRLLVVLLLSVIGRGHALVLSPEYSVTWDYDSSTSGGNVTFEVVVETRGFVGFGLSPTGGMTSADIVIGGVGSDGTPYFMVTSLLIWDTVVGYFNSFCGAGLSRRGSSSSNRRRVAGLVSNFRRRKRYSHYIKVLERVEHLRWRRLDNHGKRS